MNNVTFSSKGRVRILKLRKIIIMKSAKFNFKISFKMLPGSSAEDFTLPSFINGGTIEEFTLSSHRGKYVLIIFYPVDFGYVTPTEFYHLESLMPRFKELNCEVLAISTEHLDGMRGWWDAPKSDAGLGKIKDVRMLSDTKGDVCRAYGVYKHLDNVAFRCTALLDTEGNLVSIEKSDLPVGLNMEEQLRHVQALHELDANSQGVGVPADWQPGELINTVGFIQG